MTTCRQRGLARAVRAHDGVDLARRDREVDALEDLLAADGGPQVLDLERASRHASTDHVVAVDADVVHGHRLGGRQRLRLARRRARTSCRASSTRSPGRRRAPRPRTATPRHGCRCHRWRTGRRRSGRRPACTPPTSKRRAVPGARSSSEHTRSLGHHASLRSSLAAPGATRSGTSARRGQAFEHLVEEAEHDEPLGQLGRHAAALEVEALLLVDRPDGAGVGAAHVVGLDLEVGHALGPGVLGELQVAVRLEGVGAPGLLAHPDEARCTRSGRGPATAPLNSRFERVFGAAWSWRVRKSCIWSPSPK